MIVVMKVIETIVVTIFIKINKNDNKLVDEPNTIIILSDHKCIMSHVVGVLQIYYLLSCAGG